MRSNGPFGKHPRQVVLDARLGITGPPPDLAGASFVTPAELFFTRHHAPVPALEAGSHRVTIGGRVHTPLALTVDELRARFPNRTVPATLSCAGLRRAELHALKAIPGELLWGPEPVSHGVWTGVALGDVLAAAGIGAEARHVAFSGRDRVERPDGTIPFGASIPLDKACAPEVLLACELNGAPLPPIHGFPLRVVVPGYIGARSVKWLEAIHVQEAPSDNHFQARAYRTTADEPLTDTPVNAVIWQPAPGTTLAAGRRTIQGWAMGKGGGALATVEISADDGVTWRAANLREPAESWSWQFWEAAVDLVAGSATLVVRATDEGGNTMPAGLEAVWNPKGYANHAWHRVTVAVADKS